MNPVVKPHHLESLEFVFIGAAPVGEVLASKFKEKAPNCQFREGKRIFKYLQIKGQLISKEDCQAVISSKKTNE